MRTLAFVVALLVIPGLCFALGHWWLEWPWAWALFSALLPGSILGLLLTMSVFRLVFPATYQQQMNGPIDHSPRGGCLAPSLLALIFVPVYCFVLGFWWLDWSWASALPFALIFGPILGVTLATVVTALAFPHTFAALMGV